MIKAEFLLSKGELCGFSVSGHAGYDDYGYDIVCAAVTSAVEMTANGITEIVKAKASVDVFENEIRLLLKQDNKQAVSFLKALRLHLELLSQDYGDNIKVTDMEV